MIYKWVQGANTAVARSPPNRTVKGVQAAHFIDVEHAKAFEQVLPMD
jgi:hypothetical protein